MCQTIETLQKVRREANGRVFEVTNPGYREIGVIEVDGCLINDASRRVDWAVALPEKKKLKHGVRAVKLVELKGKDVLYAFTQIEATYLHSAVTQFRHLIDEAFVVSQMNPAFVSSVQIAVFDLQDRLNLPVKVVPLAAISAED